MPQGFATICFNFAVPVASVLLRLAKLSSWSLEEEKVLTRCGLSAGDSARSVVFSEGTELDLFEGTRWWYPCSSLPSSVSKWNRFGSEEFYAVYLKERLNVLVTL